MYICICNALTDKDVHRAVSDDGARRPAEVFAACRCRAQCGKCVRTLCGLLAGGGGQGAVATVAEGSLATA